MMRDDWTSAWSGSGSKGGGDMRPTGNIRTNVTIIALVGDGFPSLGALLDTSSAYLF